MMADFFDYFTALEIVTLFLVLATVFFLTELIKQFTRDWTKKSQGNLLPRSVAFVVGFIMTVVFWPEGSKIDPVLLGLFIGVGAPAIYRLVKWKWPVITAIATGKKPPKP